MFKKLHSLMGGISLALSIFVCAGASGEIISVATYDTYPDTALGLYVYDDYAIIGLGWGGIDIVDVSNPASPTFVSNIASPSYVRDLQVAGDLIYACDRHYGLLIIDMSDPDNPALLSICDTPGYAGDVHLQGGFAFVSDSDGGVHVIDVADPYAPSIVSTLTPGPWSNGVFIENDHLYIARTGSFKIANISDPLSAYVEGACCSMMGHDVHVLGDYAYVGDISGRKMWVIDVSQSGTPSCVTTFSTPGKARGVCGDGSLVYVTDEVLGLHALDVTDPAAPILVGSFDTPGSGFDVEIKDDLILVADKEGGLAILKWRPFNVAFDIKPGSCPNPLNVKSYRNTGIDSDWDAAGDILAKVSPSQPDRRAVFPVAILGTAGFDVTEIDITTVLLEGVSPLRHSLEDVATPVGPDAEECECRDDGPDGFDDLTLKFDKYEIVQTLGEVYDGAIIPLTMSGKLLDGTPFEGVDCVVIRGGDDLPPLTSTFGLSNYPNPFNPSTRIAFKLSEAGDVRLEIINIMGQKVTTLVDSYLPNGAHEVEWNASSVASGVYFYRLTAGGMSETKRMLLLK